MSFNSETTIHIVDNLRKSAIDNPFSSLFVNKYTIGIREVFIRYLTTFSPQVLFFEGDLRAVYAYFYHGLFFLIDSLFLLLGGAFLVKKQLKIFILLFGLALLAPLTSALNQVGTSYVHRSFFLLPILITFISYGIYSLYSVSKKFVPPTITSILIFLILIASYAHFLHFYFFIYPITSGEFYALNNRIVANFARTSSPSQPIEVYTSNPRDAPRIEEQLKATVEQFPQMQGK